MWLRGGINYEAWIGTVSNVPTHAKFRRSLQHHLQAGEGNLHNSDNATDTIDESHYQIIRSAGHSLLFWKIWKASKGARRKNSRRPLEDQSKNPAVLCGRILVSSCSMVTSISSPSNPSMTTSSVSDGPTDCVFIILVLSVISEMQ